MNLVTYYIIRCADWIELAYDKDQWLALVNAVIEPSGSLHGGEFLD
jgi:hypothetical protein